MTMEIVYVGAAICGIGSVVRLISPGDSEGGIVVTGIGLLVMLVGIVVKVSV